MARKAHLTDGARVENPDDQDDVNRFDLSAVLAADPEPLVAVGKSACPVGPRRTLQQRFALLDLAGKKILGAFAGPASPGRAAHRAT